MLNVSRLNYVPFRIIGLKDIKLNPPLSSYSSTLSALSAYFFLYIIYLRDIY